MNVSRFAAAALLTICCGSAAARDSGLIFVSSEKDHAVTVLDGKSLAVVKVIATG